MEKQKLIDCGFEGCFYDNGVDGNKAFILTIVYSGTSFFCKYLAKWLNKNNIAVMEGRKYRRECKNVRIDIKNKLENVLVEW